MTAKIFFGNLCRFIFYYYLCTRLNRKNAQMAESVDALVSNTSGAIHPGSIPGLGTRSCKFLLAALFLPDYEKGITLDF